MNLQETILVTGATGLVGAQLIKVLKVQGYTHIKAISRNIVPIPQVETIACDILDVVTLEETMRGVDKVYHCAAAVSFDRKDKNQLFQINVSGTANVVNASLDANVKKLVHISSVAALGGKNLQRPLTENDKWDGHGSQYGKSKYLGEMEAWRGHCEGLDTVIVNPSIILGEGNWNEGSTQLFKSVYNEFPYYTDGQHGYVDVQDLVECMIALMESEISGERFIINGINISYKALFDKIAIAFGKKQPNKKANKIMAEIVWRLDYLRSTLLKRKPLLTKETAQTALASITYDSQKLLDALPQFSYTPIDQSINRIVAYLTKQYSL